MNAEIVTFLADASKWSMFAFSLHEQVSRGRTLSPRQEAAALAMMDKAKARNAADKAKVAVDLSPIAAMFEAAKGNGYKRPTYRAEGVVITRAPDTGRNAGALYVKSFETDAYLGKIVGGMFTPTADGVAEKAPEAVLVIAEDPKEAAIRFGRKTGNCSCCGRELTNRESVELGIGPICATKWGL